MFASHNGNIVDWQFVQQRHASMSIQKTPFHLRTLSSVAVLSLVLSACGGSDDATNFSDAAYQNALLLSGGALDLSSGTNAERRLGYFSDIYYDPARNQWWGLSDRGPGGGVLPYETRVQRFEVDISATGAITEIAEILKLGDEKCGKPNQAA